MTRRQERWGTAIIDVPCDGGVWSTAWPSWSFRLRPTTAAKPRSTKIGSSMLGRRTTGYCESGSIRLGGLDLLVFLVLPPEKVVAFLGVQLAVFGLYMGSKFTPNHIGMPLVSPSSRCRNAGIASCRWSNL
jgi:hypothetical protein